MTMEILKYKASEIRRSAELSAELCKIYKEMFGEVLQTSCENCIADGLFRIKYHTTINKKEKKMEENKECNFRLKTNPVQVLWVEAWHMHITNDNLTDELATNLLWINRKMLERFEKYPDNLNEIMGWDDEKTAVQKTDDEGRKVAVKSSLENVPSVEGLTKLLKADLIRKVEEYPSKIAFKESDTKAEIARAYIDRLILDSE